MAVRIRMKKMGRKHRPFFRIVAIDSRQPRDGRVIEELGTYDPMVKVKAERVKVNLDRIAYWISVGATPSDRVATLLKKIKNNDFGSAMPAPAKVAPKELPVPEAPAEAAPAEESSEAAS